MIAVHFVVFPLTTNEISFAIHFESRLRQMSQTRKKRFQDIYNQWPS